MNDANLRRRDTTKGPPLRILSLDGGGVRGYSMLIILQELMHRTYVEVHGEAPKRHEIPKPCEHFDLIVGTGTGGLIALMLGRLRLDIETCKDVYVRMTKRVFETDKTIAGIPYRSTLFKASKLEDAIRDCVRMHTISESEGNDQGDEPDGSDSPTSLNLPMQPGSAYGRPASAYGRMNRSPSVASRYSQIGTSPITDFRGPMAASRFGKPNALLYDTRENRTKTAVTAVYKGTQKGGKPAILRSYDSRKETAAEARCTIWQAGRATAATALAFKPIQIGQSIFLDEGAGKYNPSPTALDEAVINEWPGREVGVLISIGTGKRPSGTNNQQHMWWEGFVSSGMGDFAEARRRLIAKIEGCEETHKLMVQKYLFDRGVNPDNYYRLNVEVGVGEFGMNEWNRLSDISTNTRRYLAQDDVQRQNIDAAVKLARIHKHNLRWLRGLSQGTEDNRMSWESSSPLMPEPPAVPGAVELPAEEVPDSHSHSRPNSQWLSPQIYQGPSDDDKFVVTADAPHTYQPRRSGEMQPPFRSSYEAQRPSGEYQQHMGNEMPIHQTPPPRPPKTPIQQHPVPGAPPPMMPGGNMSRPPPGAMLPYPDTDGPPPIVNIARKPALR